MAVISQSLFRHGLLTGFMRSMAFRSWGYPRLHIS